MSLYSVECSTMENRSGRIRERNNVAPIEDERGCDPVEIECPVGSRDEEVPGGGPKRIDIGEPIETILFIFEKSDNPPDVFGDGDLFLAEDFVSQNPVAGEMNQADENHHRKA